MLIKQEEDYLQNLTPELSSVNIKREDSSLLQQSEETQGEHTIETKLHTENEEEDRGHVSNHDEDWGAPFSCLHSEIIAAVNNEDPARTTAESEQNKSQHENRHKPSQVRRKPPYGTCSICKKKFATKSTLRKHVQLHSGLKPFSCQYCEKTFVHKSYLKSHERRPTCPSTSRTHSRQPRRRKSMGDAVNMSKSQALKVLVTERLSAAAGEIFALFERTIAEYERELCLYKEQKPKKQEFVDFILSSNVVLPKTDDAQMPSWNHNMTPVIKEEHPGINEEVQEIRIKQEEDYLQDLSPELSSVNIKREDSHYFSKVRKPRESTP
ncbi:hypothetical protein WMY93_000214 [Mugilogobius chulae]|uniref:C2H2-type domain-containing protein n=1 Tax=Mugilogobius chulae TaxID=88201 RepID=A0AAW0Q093_9GOBI